MQRWGRRCQHAWQGHAGARWCACEGRGHRGRMARVRRQGQVACTQRRGVASVQVGVARGGAHGKGGMHTKAGWVLPACRWVGPGSAQWGQQCREGVHCKGEAGIASVARSGWALASAQVGGLEGLTACPLSPHSHADVCVGNEGKGVGCCPLVGGRQQGKKGAGREEVGCSNSP